MSGCFRASSNEAIIEAVLHNIGIACLCEWHVHEYVKRGKLTVLLQKYRLTACNIHVIYPERKFVPQKVKVLITHLRETLNKTLL